MDKLSNLERFFDGPFNDWIKRNKFIIVIIGFSLAAYAGYRSRDIRALSGQERYFPKSHPLSGAFDALIGGFNEGENG